ncbi:hypothetical protein GOP47_0027125 [Adiantum capillus-veneris]|nr:hypothetical protein GOP47_0027125 [Adiantum capillus-veneris]
MQCNPQRKCFPCDSQQMATLQMSYRDSKSSSNGDLAIANYGADSSCAEPAYPNADHEEHLEAEEGALQQQATSWPAPPPVSLGICSHSAQQISG